MVQADGSTSATSSTPGVRSCTKLKAIGGKTPIFSPSQHSQLVVEKHQLILLTHFRYLQLIEMIGK